MSDQGTPQPPEPPDLPEIEQESPEDIIAGDERNTVVLKAAAK